MGDSMVQSLLGLVLPLHAATSVLLTLANKYMIQWSGCAFAILLVQNTIVAMLSLFYFWLKSLLLSEIHAVRSARRECMGASDDRQIDSESCWHVRRHRVLLGILGLQSIAQMCERAEQFKVGSAQQGSPNNLTSSIDMTVDPALSRISVVPRRSRRDPFAMLSIGSWNLGCQVLSLL